MEVASPLTSLGPSPGGAGSLCNKRSHTCSPQLLNIGENEMQQADDHQQRLAKRRRFYTPNEIDSLSEDFSSHTLFFNSSNKSLPLQQHQQPKSIFATNGAAPSSFLKRVRMAANTLSAAESSSHGTSPTPEQQLLDAKHNELERIINEQATLIESLKDDKLKIEKKYTSLKSDHDRSMKDNTILRKAVAIQEERRIHLEQELKTCRVQSEERIKGLEQIVLTLRYHLQATQNNVTNDFMNQHRPPDVY